MRIIRFATLAAVATVGVLSAAAPAAATPPPPLFPAQGYSLTANVVNTPDDGCPTPWARDTFTRTTRITQVVPGTYKVKIGDNGSFVTADAGKPGPGASGALVGKTQGTIEGSGEFTVVGALKNEATVMALNGQTVDNSAYACKDNVPVDRTTGAWPGQFFEPGAKVGPIENWKWIYRTPCGEQMVETPLGANGKITGTPCAPKITFVNTTCDVAVGKLTVANPNQFTPVKVVIGSGKPEQTIDAGKSVTVDVAVGTAVQVFFNGKALGNAYQATKPDFCKPTVVFTQATCAAKTAKIVVTNVNGKAAIKIRVNNGAPIEIAAGASHTHDLTTGTAVITQLFGGPKTAALGSFTYAPPVCPTATETYYDNCDAVQKAGKAPLSKGQPGYREALDTDKDGIACEVEPGPANTGVITVPVANSSDTGGLPNTGVKLTAIIGGGLLVALAGAAAVLVARRRKTRFTA